MLEKFKKDKDHESEQFSKSCFQITCANSSIKIIKKYLLIYFIFLESNLAVLLLIINKGN